MINYRKSVWFFFIITYFVSWLFWLPLVLSSEGINGPSIIMIFYVLGGFGPTIVALILSYLNDGKKGIKDLIKRINFKIKWYWYITIFLLIPIFVGISLLIFIILGKPIPEFNILSDPLLIISYFFIIFFFGGPVPEEFGWRGYALDRLQLKFNSLTSSLILGSIWGLWHLPLFYITGTSQQNISLVLFILNSILLSILFTWLHNNNKGNILVALLFHTMFNLTLSVYPIITNDLGFKIFMIVLLIVDIIILLIWGPKKMVENKI